MSATVAAALKKIAVMLVTDKRVRKTIGGIILGIIVIIIMPIIAIIAIFNGDLKIDTDRFTDLVIENLNEGDREKLERVDETLSVIETKMTEAGYESRYKEAEILYLLGLVDHASEKDFADKLVGCFAEDQTDEQLVEAVNDAFGTDIAVEDFARFMEQYRF